MEPVSVRFPLKSEYVMIARLTASGYCARLGLDLEKTEDIKVTIAEILNKCILLYEGKTNIVETEFRTMDGYLVISFKMKDIACLIRQSKDGDLGFSIIEALSDGLEFDGDDVLFVKFLYKEHA
jgi:anti-sigma regulatory factor (Ser/Thr protein kinase)